MRRTWFAPARSPHSTSKSVTPGWRWWSVPPGARPRRPVGAASSHRPTRAGDEEPLRAAAARRLPLAEAWASEDPASLAGALRPFTSEEPDPGARFEAWARPGAVRSTPTPRLRSARCSTSRSTRRARRSSVTERRHWSMTSPDPRGEAMFHLLESELGYEGLARLARGPLRGPSPLRRPVHHGLLDEGIGVKDMLDAQSLTLIAALERDLWAVDPPATASAIASRPRTRISRMRPVPQRGALPCGVGRVPPRRGRGAVLPLQQPLARRPSRGAAPLRRRGHRVIHDWPHLPVQMDVYNHCLEGIGTMRAGSPSSTWTSSCSPRRQAAARGVAPSTSSGPAVGVNWAMFGTSGHAAQPGGARDRELHAPGTPPRASSVAT